MSRYTLAVGIGWLISAVALATEPGASQSSDRGAAGEHVEEIVVVARHPGEPKRGRVETATLKIPTQDFSEVAGLTDRIIFEPDISLNL